jgi:hypothetical protein
VGAAAAIGSIPFGETYKVGKPLVSIVRGGLYGGGGEAARELAESGTLDPASIATAGGVGAATSGLLGKFSRLPKATVGKSPEELSRLLSGGVDPSLKELPNRPMMQTPEIQDLINRTPKPPMKYREGSYKKINGIWQNPEVAALTNGVPAPTGSQESGDLIKPFLQAAKTQAKVVKAQALPAQVAAKEAVGIGKDFSAAAKAQALKDAVKAAQLDEEAPQLLESISAPTEAGSVSIKRPYPPTPSISTIDDVPRGTIDRAMSTVPDMTNLPEEDAAEPLAAIKKLITPKVAESTPVQRAAFDTANQAEIAAQKPTATFAGWGEPEPGIPPKPWFHTSTGDTVEGAERVGELGETLPDYPPYNEAERVAGAAAKNAKVAGAFGKKIEPKPISPGLAAKQAEATRFAPEDKAKLDQMVAAYKSGDPKQWEALGYTDKGRLGRDMAAHHRESLARAVAAENPSYAGGPQPPIKTYDALLNTIKANPIPEAPLTPPTPTPLDQLTKTQTNRSPGWVKGGRKEVVARQAMTPEALAAAEAIQPGRDLSSMTAADIAEARDTEQIIDKIKATRAGKTPPIPLTPEEQIAAQARDQSIGNRLRKNQSGEMNPALLKFLTGATGAVIGAPIGANLNQYDPLTGALQGAAVGGIAGTAMGARSIDPIIRLRNAGLLSGIVQAKKPLADAGIMAGTAMEKLLSGALHANPEDLKLGGRMMKESFRVPTNVYNYVQGIKHPGLLEGAMGDIREATPTDLLGMTVRPLTGAMYATQQAMDRAGMPLDEIKRALLTTANPQSEVGSWWLKGQKYTPIRVLRPFAKFGTNWMEQGIQRIPGLSYLPESMVGTMKGPAQDRAARSILGAGSMGAGYLEGQREQEQADEGTPVSPAMQGLLKAAVGRYGLPFVLGEAMVPGGVNRLIQSIPGTQAVMPIAQKSEDIIDYLKRFGAGELNQAVPAFLNPTTNPSVM